MPAIEILTGVSQVNTSQDIATPVPSFAAVTGLSWAAVPTNTLVLNSPEHPLLLADTYTCYAAAVSRDLKNKGYTIGIATPVSGALTLTNATDGLLFHIPATSVASTGLEDMVAVAFFLSVNGSKPRIAGFQYIPTDGSDMYHLICSKPITRAQNFAPATLTAATDDPYLGSRDGAGVGWLAMTPTSGGVRLMHKYDRVPYRPDDAPDAEFRTTQGTDLEFNVISGSNQFINQAIGGNFVSFNTTYDTFTHEQVSTDLYTALAFVKGNRAIRIDMPQSSTGKQTTRIMLGNVDFNVVDITEDTSKTDMYRLDFRLQAVAQDYLCKNLHNTAMVAYF